jgi:hypothetical protein
MAGQEQLLNHGKYDEQQMHLSGSTLQSRKDAWEEASEGQEYVGHHLRGQAILIVAE